MAAPVSAWAKPGAWALDSEEHEAELLQQKDKDDTSQFPSLSVAAATKPKKKKAQPISLADFTTYGGPKPFRTSRSDALTHEDIMMLPTAPRERTAEELERDRSRLGGGFRSYGSYDRPNRNSGGDESSNSRWGSSRVSDGSFGRDSNREMAPSRADEIDNWAAAKKSTVGNGFERRDSFERRDRDRGGFFDSQSRADGSDNWVSNKNFVPSEGRRFGSNGGGFERERKVGFGSSGGAESDNWNSKKGESNVGGGIDRTETPSGRPRLNLQPRSLPLSNGSQEGSGNVEKPKGPNPFGDARPREEVLAEKGQDWKKIDEQLDAMKTKETVEKKEGFGKRGFGSGNGRSNLPEEKAERSWRKAVSDDSRPTSAEKSEDGHVEEN
ncbi:hypothetical protein K1719_005633 [Acacia pycnantha]|nr:hypothetical protein K1719_005633 [Acacia pycnantha]